MSPFWEKFSLDSKIRRCSFFWVFIIVKRQCTEICRVFVLEQKKKKENRLVVCCRSCIALSPALISSPSSCAIRELFLLLLFSPVFSPVFFRTGLDDVSSNKYQKLVLILVNTGQDNDKEWDELFFIVFFLSPSHCKFFLPLTRDYWYWSLGQSVGRIFESTSRIGYTSRQSWVYGGQS